MEEHCHKGECGCAHHDEHERGHEHTHEHGILHANIRCSCCGHGDGGQCGTADESPLKRILLSLAFFAAALAVRYAPIALFDGSVRVAGNVREALSVVLFLASFLLSGKDVVLHAAQSIFKGRLFEEQFLMSLASFGAVGLGQYAEACAIMLFYQIGEFFQDYAADKSRKSINALMEIRPDKATVVRGGEKIEVRAEEVAIGETIIVKPGERIPLDGVVGSGKSFVNNSQLTGESVPQEVYEGIEVFSGAVNGQGALEIKTLRHAEESAAARIIKLAEEASEKKTRAERFITRFSKVYTPIVCVLALLTALIPSIVTGDVRTWLSRAIIFLVVSCPCALVISVPLSFFSGIGDAARQGILLKGSAGMEALANAKTAVFDKTGTLTKGSFIVMETHPANPDKISSEELIVIAAHAECFSSHPVSKSLKEQHHGECCKRIRAEGAEELSGRGIKIEIDGRKILAGNETLMAENNIEFDMACLKDDAGTFVHVAVDGEYAGHIVIADEIKDGAANAVRDLKKLGVKKIVMLTGDAEKTAKKTAAAIGLDEAHANLLPEDKVRIVEQLLLPPKDGRRRGTLFFAGDGINDAPVLSRADAGIAMGALGTDAAIEAADVVIMSDEPAKIAQAVRLSKRTLFVVYQNIIFSLGVKAAIMALGAAGITGMWLAVFGDVGVTVIAVLNAMRRKN
ncbi:MAG: heavy metal translocating P-type ATPase [Treponema sp.]